MAGQRSRKLIKAKSHYTDRLWWYDSSCKKTKQLFKRCIPIAAAISKRVHLILASFDPEPQSTGKQRMQMSFIK